MDRFYFLDSSVVLGDVITSCKGIRLYDGDTKTKFEGEVAHLTPCHFFLTSGTRPKLKLVLDLKCVILMDDEAGGMLRSSKIILHLSQSENIQHSRPVARSTASYIKLSFTEGGSSQLKQEMTKVLSNKAWEKTIRTAPAPPSQVSSVTRSGIVGIERKMQEKMQNTATNINVAFQDLKNLMDMAKDMVRIANAMSTKIKERQGDISEDETVKFKSYLLSLGIDDPVTRESCASGDSYRRQLAKQMVDFLQKPITEMGGMMAVTDAYCRVNRARGLELLSPEDFLQSCRLMKELNLPVKLREYDSGVLVLQLQSQSDAELDKETFKLLEERQKLTAVELSQILSISVLLARERLLSAEKAAFACRDDTVQGLIFYPNLFLHDLAENVKLYRRK